MFKTRFNYRYLPFALAFALALFLIGGATPLRSRADAPSSTFTVTEAGDDGDGICDASCTLRDAVLAANNSTTDDTINFDPSLTTITLAGEIMINNNGSLTINGPGADALTIDGGPGTNRIFYVNAFVNLTIAGVTLTGGDGGGTHNPGNGGAIFVDNGHLTLNGVNITGNSVTTNQKHGGGILILGLGIANQTTTIQNSTFSNNTAASGGGLHIRGSGTGNLTIHNSTFSGNSAIAGDGGGGLNITGTSTTLRSVTITGNVATDNTPGGGFRVVATVVNMGNTIIAGNSGTNGPDIFKDGLEGVDSVGYNLVGNAVATGNGGPVSWQDTDILNTSPMLGPLQNNGGPTPSHAPLTGSQAIDKGRSFELTTDQRGFLRPVDDPMIANAFDGADIGAFEVQPTCPEITLDPSSLPGGTVGSLYSQQISASGADPHTFAVTDGSLPPGLTLDPITGGISGTPTTPGMFGFTLTATDANDCTGSQAYSIEVVCPTISLSPSSLASGTVGSAYSESVSASGGTSPYTYEVTSGSLPAGLSLDSSTGEISGMPAVSGTTNFTITATDSYGCTGSRQFSITVAPAPAPTPELSINDVEALEGNNGASNFTFTVTLSPADSQPVTVTYATANGSALAGSDYNAASGTLTIPAGSTSGTINIKVKGDKVWEADETFTVNLSNATNANIADGQGTGTILNDDPPSADLVITKSAPSGTYRSGDQISYTITVTNNGPTPAAPTVIDNLPSQLTFFSCSATNGGECGGTGNNRTVTFDTLSAGTTATVTLVAQINAGVAGGTKITNTAGVSSAIPDPITRNNTASVTITTSRK